MKLAELLNAIDPETYVNILDRTYGIDYGVKLIDQLYEDRTFRRELPTKTVHNVSAVVDDRPEIQAYICIVVN